jgi:type III pantothenate kinase
LRRAGVRARAVGWRDPWPFVLAVRRPDGVGADRLANAAGLAALGHASGIAIDVGTAVTIDVLLRRRFLGGLILPGFGLQAGALRAHTALLPLVSPGAGAPLLGADTRGAIAAGIGHGLRHAVAGATAALQARHPELRAVVLTGGGAELVAGALPRARSEPGLLVLGLRLLAASHGPS